jgi:hypothetical protein
VEQVEQAAVQMATAVARVSRRRQCRLRTMHSHPHRRASRWFRRASWTS